MRATACLLAILLLIAPATADVEADKRLCADASLDPETRVAACERLLADDAAAALDRAWAYTMRGLIHRRASRYDDAVADFTKAAELDAKNAVTFEHRGLAHYYAKRYDASIADMSRAIELDARRYYPYFVRGLAHSKQKRRTEALADYTRAIAASPRAYSVYAVRASLHQRMKQFDKALADCNTVLELSPFHAPSFKVRAEIHEELGNVGQAIHDARMAQMLNPNLDSPRYVLERLVKPAPAPDGEVAYSAPAKGLRMTFLSTASKAAPKKSEMEESIAALAGWFRAKPQPVPYRKALMQRTVAFVDGSTTNIRPARLDRKVKAPVDTVGYSHAMWPQVIPSPMGALAIENDEAAIAKLFPLKAGGTGSGGGEVVFTCPGKPTPMSRAMGCKPGEKISMGTVEWSAKVLHRERVTVAAGTFDAVVIETKESFILKMFGRAMKRESTVTSWYVPEIGFWVKRERLAEGDRILDEAATIE